MIDDPKPLPPEIIADALQDRIHKDDGKVRSVRSVKSFELKPCPCGSKASCDKLESGYWKVTCDVPGCDWEMDCYRSEKAAVQRWNHRAESEELTQLRENLFRVQNAAIDLCEQIEKLKGELEEGKVE